MANWQFFLQTSPDTPFLLYNATSLFNALFVMNTTTLQSLPASSNASLSKGMWYVFYDGNDIIRAWGSGWTGLERVYFNDELVVRHHHFKRLESVSFEKNNHRYQIQCFSTSLQKWQAHCSFWRDGKKQCTLKCKRRKLFNVRPTAAHMTIGLVGGLISGALQAPVLFGVLFIFMSLSLTLLTTAKTDDFVIEQEPIAS